MKEYSVTFTQYWSYTVYADSEDEAEEEAKAYFDAEMHRPYAHCFYDEVGVECTEQEEADDADL